MTSMFDIVSEAASRGWDRARRAAFRNRETASPDALARLIEGDIIPRLLLNHRESIAPALPAAAPVTEIPDGVADQFAAATLTEEVGPLLARVETLMAGGVGVEAIYLHLLAPAARRLGSWWDEDACDFVDVTMGLWRLQEIVNALAALLPGVSPVEGSEKRALFSPAPGEQHGLGAIIVEEFFRRAGWQTWSAPALDEAELVALTAGREFDIVGLTVSVERHVQPLERTIAAVRRASRNPDVLILVGGRVFTEQPELAQQIGADGTAADGQLAVALADKLILERSKLAALPSGS
jgi:MerR family transcriptional regulator, light-induced transcriptional regulator